MLPCRQRSAGVQGPHHELPRGPGRDLPAGGGLCTVKLRARTQQRFRVCRSSRQRLFRPCAEVVHVGNCKTTSAFAVRFCSSRCPSALLALQCRQRQDCARAAHSRFQTVRLWQRARLGTQSGAAGRCVTEVAPRMPAGTVRCSYGVGGTFVHAHAADLDGLPGRCRPTG